MMKMNASMTHYQGRQDEAMSFVKKKCRIMRTFQSSPETRDVATRLIEGCDLIAQSHALECATSPV